MIPAIKRTGFMGMVICLILVNACSLTDQQELGAEESNRAMGAIISQYESGDPVLRSQVNLGLQASWIDSDSVRVAIRNKTGQSLGIIHKGFGIISSSGQPPSRALDSSRKTFPEVRLEPGEEVSRVLDFSPPSDRSRARLIFIHPDISPAMAYIR
jgi:hypothetical protein